MGRSRGAPHSWGSYIRFGAFWQNCAAAKVLKLPTFTPSANPATRLGHMEGLMNGTLEVAGTGADSGSRVAILALSLGAFAVGTSEFMISGLLQTVAADLAVSVPTAGFLITGYALGVVVGGPAMAFLTGRLDRRTTLLLLLTIFVLGNLLCANAPSYSLLLVGRIVTSFCHGAFYGLASVIGGALVA